MSVEIIRYPVPSRPWVIGRGLGDLCISFDTAAQASDFAVNVCGVRREDVAVLTLPPGQDLLRDGW
jgi:hypothetical protein